VDYYYYYYYYYYYHYHYHYYYYHYHHHSPIHRVDTILYPTPIPLHITLDHITSSL